MESAGRGEAYEGYTMYPKFVRQGRDEGGPATYYVCSEGGYTMAELNVAKCLGGNYQEFK